LVRKLTTHVVDLEVYTGQLCRSQVKTTNQDRNHVLDHTTWDVVKGGSRLDSAYVPSLSYYGSTYAASQSKSWFMRHGSSERMLTF